MQESSRTNRIESIESNQSTWKYLLRQKIKRSHVSCIVHTVSYSSLYCKKYNAQAYHGAYSSVDNTGTTTTTTITTTYSRHYSWDNNN